MGEELTPEQVPAHEESDDSKNEQLKSAKKWLQENGRGWVGAVVTSDDNDLIAELQRISRGELFPNEVDFINDAIASNPDPESAFIAMAQYIKEHYSDLYPVGIVDSHGELR